MNKDTVTGEVKHILVLEDSVYRRTIILDDSQYTLGRHSSNTIQMHSRQASRKHATLFRKLSSKTNQEVFWIIDGDLDGEKSQNGIYINGEKCLVRELKDGDLINFGCDINASYHCLNGSPNMLSQEWMPQALLTQSDNLLQRKSTLILSELNFGKVHPDDETCQDDSYLDPLTQLPNRTLFLEYLYIALSNARRQKKQVGLILLNLSNLTEINQALGISIGDQLLRQISKQLRNCLRHGDIVSRWAGDKFMLLLPQVQMSDDLEKVQSRILNFYTAPVSVEQYSFPLQIASGTAIYPKDSEELQSLLNIVQQNLKQMPKPQVPANPPSDDGAPISAFMANPQNLVSFSASTPQAINQATINHARINKVEKRLQRALDQGEISLYYQPQVNVKTGNIEAMEALVRWQHPQQGMISPKQFLPWADNSEMVLPMSQWILTTACTQNKTWQYQRIEPLKVSVNLSDKQFYHPQLLETVTEALANSKLEPHWLELEMTESTVLRDFASSKKLMQALESLGIQLSLDDFGVDYASIRYLQELPIHKVKIDKSFVAQLSDDPQNTMMLSALINLGQGFNIQVVAEGVETQSQLNVLQNLHCVIMQGYRFSQPLLTEDATKFLLQHHTVKM